MSDHKFPYKWTLKKAKFTKDKGKVFSCFACGGGSTMGYKLAGFNVLGMNEIDPKMAEAYIINHKPKYAYIEPIQEFKNRKDIPRELYNLDILDGSPPCSSFSMAGNREKDWGKKKKFREGQTEQVLDDLFFHYIDLAKELQSKVVIAENVKGLLMGSAMSYKTNYVREIYKAFDKAGYSVQHYLLNASKMGVPQRRERVFFIAIRKDLMQYLPKQNLLHTEFPKLDLRFNEPNIKFGEYRSITGSTEGLTEWTIERLNLMLKSDKTIGDIHKRHFKKVSRFNALLIDDKDVMPTITASEINYRKFDKMSLSNDDYCHGGSFPLDYDFCDNKVKYIIGMSVPPIFVAQIVTRIYAQWLSKLKNK